MRPAVHKRRASSVSRLRGRPRAQSGAAFRRPAATRPAAQGVPRTGSYIETLENRLRWTD